jgi:hypothetical protein
MENRRGARAQHRQKTRRDPDGADPFGLTVAGQVVVSPDGDRDLLETLMRAADVEILRGREPVLGNAQAWRTIPENHQPIGMLIRERSKQERARDAEDRRVRADADGQRDERRSRESRIPGEGANGAPQILHHPAHVPSPRRPSTAKAAPYVLRAAHMSSRTGRVRRVRL